MTLSRLKDGKWVSLLLPYVSSPEPAFSFCSACLQRLLPVFQNELHTDLLRGEAHGLVKPQRAGVARPDVEGKVIKPVLPRVGNAALVQRPAHALPAAGGIHTDAFYALLYCLNFLKFHVPL